MKDKIHPKWYPSARVTCSCGNTFTVGSTKEKIRVEVCSKCHPFFTGQQKYVDTAGRVERFQQKQKKAIEKAGLLAKKKAKKQERKTQQEEGPKTLREMLMGE